MKELIRENLDNPEVLEKLFREDSETFMNEFNLVYAEISDNLVAKTWNERLNYVSDTSNGSQRKELMLVILGSVIAAIIAKLPEIVSVDPEIFYTRNIGFIVFPILTAYFTWKNNLTTASKIFFVAVTLACALFINLAFAEANSQTLILSCIHIPLLLWTILGIAYSGGINTAKEKRISFLRYNGDLVVMTTVILLAGAIFALVSLRLFMLIDWDVSKFYTEYLIICGLAAAPIVANYVLQNNNQVVSKVSPVIARIFSPIVLVTVFIYLLAMISKGKDPFIDRDFLIVFNLLLIGVMAIILFSVAEASRTSKGKSEKAILFMLSLVTVAVNCIALSAILFRINEWGITPNRAAVLGGNMLFLANLVIITFHLWKSLKKGAGIETVSISIARFLPIYSLWAVIVAFIFPIIFRFK